MLASSLDCTVIDPPGQPRAVVVVLHGFGASADDFRPIAQQLALPEAMGVRFVFPQAPEIPIGMLGGQRMRAWFDFKPADGVNPLHLAASAMGGLAGAESAGFGALIESSVNFPGLDKATLWIRDLLQNEIDNGVPAERIVLAGFSQGGALALNAGLLYPKPLGGMLALSTFLADRSRLGSPRARANAATPILMCHGQRDAVVPLALGKEGHDGLRAAGYPVAWQEFPMAHEVCPAQIAAISRWLQQRLSAGVSHEFLSG
jgi:phospholipase/carboxylesterase